MIEHISEYVSKPDYCQQFELAFGPGGAWDKLFSRCEGYRGTSVLRDSENPNRFLIVDLWKSVELRDLALKEQEPPFSELIMLFQEWTLSISDLGVFRIRTQASVRPVRKGSV